MCKIKTVIIFIVALNYTSRAQNNEKPPIDRLADLSFFVGSSQGGFVISGVHNWKLGKKNKIEIGLGARFTTYFGSDQYLRTAPAKLTSGKTGPGVLFSEDIIKNIDSIKLSSTQINCLNLTINLGYDISTKFSAGFNIDAIGFSFGGSKKGLYFPKSGPTEIVSAKPTAFNLLLISDNDYGTLNSEFFLRYKWSDKWNIKAGFLFLFTEYTTDNKVQTTPDGDKNDRFRNKVSAFTAGIVYHF